MDPTQDNRLIQISTPLGKDVLLLQSFSGQEGVSTPFHFDLTVNSLNKDIQFEQIVGKPATIKIVLPEEKERFINGIISSFTLTGASGEFTVYQATLVPRLWILTRNSDCRIFQKQTVLEIIDTILKENKVAPVLPRVDAGRYKPREYCVQYTETDYNFISRLMEEEGIFYYFEHKDGEHTLVLADHPSKFQANPFFKDAIFHSAAPKALTDFTVTSWNAAQELRPDMYELRDYNFKQPRLDLTAQSQTGNDASLAIYDFPGYYQDKETGKRIVDMRMEEIETSKVVVSAASNIRALMAAFKFTLTGHFRKDFDQQNFIVTSIFHVCKQGDNYRSNAQQAVCDFSYANKFHCILEHARYRPPRLTQVPAIPSTQTAIVIGRDTTGPDGTAPPPPAPHTPKDEIYADNYGRVRVRFHWDRSTKNGDTTCFIRVAQPWAASGWGHQWIPRIGQEVVVTFLEGNPDQPLITGAVYNGDNELPFTIPDYQTQSGLRSRSNPTDPDGPNDKYHMLRFDDKIDHEQVFLRSQKRLDVRALATYYDTSGSDRNTLIGGKDDKGNQGGNYYLTVGNDTDIHINGGLYQRVEKPLNLTIVGDVICDFEADQKVLVKTNSELNAQNIIIEAKEKISLMVGGSFITIDSGGVTIVGPMVKINSGGAGTPCSSPDIEDPLDAAPADTGKPGYVQHGAKGPWKRRKRHLTAEHAPPFVPLPPVPPPAGTPQEKVKGTPVPIPPGDDSIVCRGGKLVLQINDTGPDRSCTEAHEGSHVQDWKNRYGEDLCSGVPDGSLPVGGENYTEFLRQSECKAYKVGKACREKFIKTAQEKDKPGIQRSIDRDNAQIKANKCD
jgi:type VI secretion system secreted protein VgrG